MELKYNILNDVIIKMKNYICDRTGTSFIGLSPTIILSKIIINTETNYTIKIVILRGSINIIDVYYNVLL